LLLICTLRYSITIKESPIGVFSHFLLSCSLCLVTMPAVGSFDRLFGVDGPIGSVWLDATAPTLSPKALHSLVVTSGLIEASQAKAT
jgi:hypothetical protein